MINMHAESTPSTNGSKILEEIGALSWQSCESNSSTENKISPTVTMVYRVHPVTLCSNERCPTSGILKEGAQPLRTAGDDSRGNNLSNY